MAIPGLALLLALAPPAAGSSGGLITEEMRRAAAAAPSVQGEGSFQLFHYVGGATPKPSRGTRTKLRVPDPDPDLLPSKDNYGLTKATPFYDSDKLAYEWDNGPYAGSGENRTIAFFPRRITVRYRLRQFVFLDQGIPAGSCLERETFKHELVHFDDNQAIYDESKTQLAALLESLRAESPIGAPGAPASIEEIESKVRRVYGGLAKRRSAHGAAANASALENMAAGIREHGLNIIASPSAPVHLKADSRTVARYQQAVLDLLAEVRTAGEKSACMDGVVCYFQDVVSRRMREKVEERDFGTQEQQATAGWDPPMNRIYLQCKREDARL